ncbi:hypothetical protein JOE09_005288 [Pantoea coffeiphila]|nr:hypothetical protein [Pantoea coffeiphila]
MKYVVKTHFGFVGQPRIHGTTRSVGTFRNAERAYVAVKLYLHWAKTFPVGDIPRKPTHVDAFNSFGF